MNRCTFLGHKWKVVKRAVATLPKLLFYVEHEVELQIRECKVCGLEQGVAFEPSGETRLDVTWLKMKLRDIVREDRK